MRKRINFLILLFRVFHLFTLVNGSSDFLKKLAWPYINNLNFSFPTPDSINVNTHMARPVLPIPRYVYTDMRITDTLTNTGQEVLISPDPSSAGSYFTIGGVLGPHFYDYIGGRLVWSDNVAQPAGTMIDDESVPFQKLMYFLNRKYQNVPDGLSHRDGIAIMVTLIEVIDGEDNAEFEDLRRVIQEVQEAGTSAPLPRTVLINWLHEKKVSNTTTYSYPSSYTNPDSGIEGDCATLLVSNSVTKPSISLAQFNTLRGILNPQGQQYQSVIPVSPTDGRPVVVTRGTVIRQFAHNTNTN